MDWVNRMDWTYGWYRSDGINWSNRLDWFNGSNRQYGFNRFYR